MNSEEIDRQVDEWILESKTKIKNSIEEKIKNYTLLFMPETNEVEIKIIHANRREISIRFFGIIKNKAELKRLMVQLSIL